MLGSSGTLTTAAMASAESSTVAGLRLATVLGTACAVLLVVTAALWVRTHARVVRPGALQILGEATIEAADRGVGARPQWIRDRIAALAMALFWFILVANWFHLAPGVAWPAPTADLNLTLALALLAIGMVHATAQQARGIRGELRRNLRPWWLAPVKLLEELLKPLTLGLRLFGMTFASELMFLLIIELIAPHVAVVPHALWTLFDLFIGVIQAYVFA